MQQQPQDNQHYPHHRDHSPRSLGRLCLWQIFHNRANRWTSFTT
jgi:hypothetical protein